MPINPATDAYAFPSLTINVGLLLIIEKNLRANNCRYGLGAKAPFLTCTTAEIHAIDCSGFVRYALARTASIIIPDGSVQQHDWAKARGFKHSTGADAANKDGAVRIAFLAPEDSDENIGHVMLLPGDGQTVESHGGIGPDRRAWDVKARPWMGKCSVFVLSPPIT